MPRKKPYSGKAKAEQLKLKRERRRRRDAADEEARRAGHAEHEHGPTAGSNDGDHRDGAVGAVPRPAGDVGSTGHASGLLRELPAAGGAGRGGAGLVVHRGRNRKPRHMTTVFMRESDEAVELRRAASDAPVCVAGERDALPTARAPYRDSDGVLDHPQGVTEELRELKRRREGEPGALLDADACIPQAVAESGDERHDGSVEPVERAHSTGVAQQVAKAEQHYFQEWLQNIYAKYHREHLNHFEHNLEVWRQLWRVLVESDVIALVADVRNPLYHIPVSLYTHVVKTLDKPLVIVLSKVGLVEPRIIESWTEYLSATFPLASIVPFDSTGIELHKLRGISQRRKALVGARSAKDHAVLLRRRESVRLFLHAVGAGALADAVEAKADAARDTSCGVTEAPRRRRKQAQRAAAKTVTRSTRRKKTAEDRAAELASALALADVGVRSDDSDSMPVEEAISADRVSQASALDGSSPPRCDAAGDSHTAASTLRVGLIGSPNVGKSSLINTISGTKRVSVSKTAGHTKRAQTIEVVPGLTLLDCPGLVFPAALVPPQPTLDATDSGDATHAEGAEPTRDGDRTAGVPEETTSSPKLHEFDRDAANRERAIQECLGVLPLAQVRETFSAVRFLAEHLPLDSMYGLKIPDDEDTDAWSPLLLCEALAIKRGYRLDRVGRPDAHRAGREILSDAVDGLLGIAFEPPGPDS